MAKAKKPASKSKKKPVEQYARKGKQRAKNPPVGLVTRGRIRKARRRCMPTIRTSIRS